MSNILDTYIPKFLVALKNKENDDVIFVSSSNFSTNGDVYVLDTRTIVPNVIATNESNNELQPDVSDVYPYKIVPEIDIDGATIVYTPTLENDPTASQHYYAPLYFERYKTEIVNAINKQFTELELLNPFSTTFEDEEVV